jgi:hypothetical protein
VLVLAAASVVPAGEVGCLGATQVTLVLSTDVDCKQTITTTITTSAPDAPTAVPAATTTTCQSGGDLGTLVLVPSGDRGGHVNVEVVTAVGVPASACVRPAFGPSCIVARRSLGFLPHTGLTLPIAMRDACRGILCGPTDTCVSGVCRSAALDPNACQDPGGCTETALGPPASPTPLADGGAVDASADDASTIDAGLPDAAVAVPELLYTGTREIDSIALGDANLFFLESPTDFNVGDGAVRIMPLAGGASTLLAGGLFQPVSLAANPTNLYWFESGSLQSVLKKGGAVTTILAPAGVGTTPLSVQANSTYLYWGTAPMGSGSAFRALTNGPAKIRSASRSAACSASRSTRPRAPSRSRAASMPTTPAR